MYIYICVCMYVYIYIQIYLLLCHITSLFGFRLRFPRFWSKNRSRFHPREVFTFSPCFAYFLPVAHKLRKICENLLILLLQGFWQCCRHPSSIKKGAERRPSDLVQPDANTFNHGIQHLSSYGVKFRTWTYHSSMVPWYYGAMVISI